MYDYKFRQTDGASRRPRRPLRKTLIQVAGALSVTVALLALAYLAFQRPAPEQRSQADSNIVPLALPPQRNLPRD